MGGASYRTRWPREVVNKLTLTENEGKTSLTIQVELINATEEELKTFAAVRVGLQQGFAGTFDQLDEYLAKA